MTKGNPAVACLTMTVTVGCDTIGVNHRAFEKHCASGNLSGNEESNDNYRRRAAGVLDVADSAPGAADKVVGTFD